MMKEDTKELSDNSLLQALRSNGTDQPGDEAPDSMEPVVAATVEAMSATDQATRATKPAGGAATAAGSGDPKSDSGRMEAVVDLLFGNHLTEINASMRALEKQVTERVNKAEAEMRTRIESLDRQIKDELASLNKEVEKERMTRDDAVADLGERIDTAVGDIDKRLEKMEADFDRTQELAQKDLGERITKANDETALLRKTMEQEVASMKVSLSTRAELSSMFAELGKRLEANAAGVGLGE